MARERRTCFKASSGPCGTGRIVYPSSQGHRHDSDTDMRATTTDMRVLTLRSSIVDMLGPELHRVSTRALCSISQPAAVL